MKQRVKDIEINYLENGEIEALDFDFLIRLALKGIYAGEYVKKLDNINFNKHWIESAISELDYIINSNKSIDVKEHYADNARRFLEYFKEEL